MWKNVNQFSAQVFAGVYVLHSGFGVELERSILSWSVGKEVPINKKNCKNTHSI